MGRKDILWKGLLEWVFEDLLRFLFIDAEEVFDFSKGFGFLDKELAEMCPESEGKIDVRHVDKLVKAYRKSGTEEWVLIHIEVQDKTGAKDRPLFPERMFRYFYRCFDRYGKPVAAIAIFCGPDGNQLHNKYHYAFMGTKLQYSYNTLCILDYADEELGKSTNPFAWVVLAAKQALLKGKDLDEKLMEGKLFIFRKLYENGVFEKEKLQAVLKFLENYVQFEKKETIHTFRSKINEITHKANVMDIFEQVEEMRREEGRVEGRKEGRRKGVKEGLERAVRSLLLNTEFSVKKIAEMVEVPVSLVEKIKKELKAK